MRNTNCRNVRRDIEEAGNGDFLSAQAHAHIQTCEPCATIAARQSSLSALMSSLGTIEAPGDFDFRLRARLAGERQGNAQVLSSKFSFRYGFAAVALTLVAAAAFMLTAYRNTINSEAPKTVAANQENQAPKDSTQPVNPAAVAIAPKEEAVAVEASSERQPTPKRRELAGLRPGSRIGTRTTSSTPAEVLSKLGETHPKGSFPINASYQSLKVSVDDGSGGFRTISLPTVSFGSQRTVSQNPTPLMASSRGVW